MKKLLTSIVLASAALCGYAQETYESATIADNDLNGTARYVGMGGAMEALGADISTIGTNPAGIGMFRKSQISFSAGLQSCEEKAVLGGDKSKFSFDQIGLVYSMRTGYADFLNFGFNYHKSKNFNSMMNVSDALDNASQNKLSFLKNELGVFANDDINFSQVDYLYDNVLCGILDKKGNVQQSFYQYFNANSYNTQRMSEGYTSDFDFNLSANLNNRVYLGLTLSISDVNYSSYSIYTENYGKFGTLNLRDEREIDGTGAALKAGIIVRPIETSPFRIGAYIHTPYSFDLTTRNYTVLTNNLSSEPGKRDIGNYDNGHDSESYDFVMRTPWKFGLSLGHTIGDYLAIGATYDYSDYNYLSNRVIDGYDYYYDQDESSADRIMNDHTKQCLKGVHTLKIGAECKPIPELAVRVGYNYVSPKYNVDGYKDGSLESYGSYYASQTDYINWKSTNRLTLGLGVNLGNFTIDAAYQYSQTDGEYAPFMSYYDNGSNPDYNNICDVAKVSNNRHQLLFTLGYKF